MSGPQATAAAGRRAAVGIWRPRRAQAVTMVTAIVLGVGCLVCWFAFPPDVRATFTPAQLGTLILFLGFVDASLVAYSRCSVRVEPAALVLHNVWRRRRIAWEDIRGLRYRKDDPWPMVFLTGERRVGVMGIQTADGPLARRNAAELAAAIRPHLLALGDLEPRLPDLGQDRDPDPGRRS